MPKTILAQQEHSLTADTKLVVSHGTWRKKDYVDVRVHWQSPSGDWFPTKKGVRLDTGLAHNLTLDIIAMLGPAPTNGNGHKPSNGNHANLPAQLERIDAELDKPRITGGRPAMLVERAKIQAQVDVAEILSNGGDHHDLLSRELDDLRAELSTRTLPFRGRWASRRFVPQEKDMPMGGLSAEERATRPSAAQSRATKQRA